MNRRITIAAAAAMAALTFAAPGVSAKGGTSGGGGGGTTTSFAAIRTTSTTVTCSAGTVLSLTFQKGFDKRVEIVVTPVAGATNPDGAPVPAAWWNQRVQNTTAGTSLGAWGGNVDLVPGLRQTVLLGGVPTGTWTLTYSAERRDLPAGAIDPAFIATLPVQETCSGAVVVAAR